MTVMCIEIKYFKCLFPLSGETLVNVLDCKKDMGLWHGVLTSVMNRIHTITVPYAVMKACPMSWVQRVHIHKGKATVSFNFYIENCIDTSTH
jgi:hypothetical protein